MRPWAQSQVCCFFKHLSIFFTFLISDQPLSSWVIWALLGRILQDIVKCNLDAIASILEQCRKVSWLVEIGRTLRFGREQKYVRHIQCQLWSSPWLSCTQGWHPNLASHGKIAHKSPEDQYQSAVQLWTYLFGDVDTIIAISTSDLEPKGCFCFFCYLAALNILWWLIAPPPVEKVDIKSFILLLSPSSSKLPVKAIVPFRRTM